MTPHLDAEEILARILSADPSFESPSDPRKCAESGFIDDDLYETAPLSEDDTSPDDNTATTGAERWKSRSIEVEYIGEGAKKKTAKFHIPLENFNEYHSVNLVSSSDNSCKRKARRNDTCHKNEVKEYVKSDSVEKLDEDVFLHEEKAINSSLSRRPHKCIDSKEHVNKTSTFTPDVHNNGMTPHHRKEQLQQHSVGMNSSKRLSTGSTSSRHSSSSEGHSVHYASTNIISIPSPSHSSAPQVPHRTSKKDTGQALGSLRKRVQIVQDDSSVKLVPYTVPRHCATRVAFPAATWDLMMQNFRIALSLDNVFICDNFLGNDPALHLMQELQMLKNSGHFERHMRRSSNPAGLDYACLFLTEPDASLQRLDGLALMVHKLARYCASDWKQTSVQIIYYPNGHALDTLPKQDSQRQLLKCVYFASSGIPSKAVSTARSGRFFIDTNGQETVVEPKFDRLLAFWSDSISHRIEPCLSERFIINIWMVR